MKKGLLLLCSIFIGYLGLILMPIASLITPAIICGFLIPSIICFGNRLWYKTFIQFKIPPMEVTRNK